MPLIFDLHNPIYDSVKRLKEHRPKVLGWNPLCSSVLKALQAGRNQTKEQTSMKKSGSVLLFFDVCLEGAGESGEYSMAVY